MALTSWRVAPAAHAVLRQANIVAPDRDRSSDGTIGDPAHSSRSSDHNPSSDGYVYAVDLTDDDASGIDCREIARQIVERRDRRVKYLISEGRMIRSYPLLKDGRVVTPAWTWTTYSGANGHFKHLHVSVLAKWRNDASFWWVPPAPAATPTEEDDMAAGFIFNDGEKTYLRDGGDLVHIPSMEDVNALLALGFKDGRKLSAEMTKRLLEAAKQ